MKNKMILTTILLLSCAITGLYAAAPGGTGAAAVYKPSEDAASNLEDMWLFHSLMPDALAQQLTKNWIKAGRNRAPSIEEVTQHFGGEGGLFTPAILEKVRRNLILSGSEKFIELPLSKAYKGDYGSFRNALIAFLNDALTKAGANHGVALNISSSNLGGLVRDNPGQFVDLMHEIHATIDRHRCILTRLNLDGNGLTTLPEDAFGQFGSLRELSINFNQLTTLPPGVFTGLTNLQELWLDGNKFATLRSDTFAGLTNLQKLSLDANQLVTLPPDIFAGLANLQKLSLNGNQLANLPPRIFAGLTKLQQLWLNENQLATLPPDIFAGLINLQILSLNGNQLAIVPPDIFAGLINLKILLLHSNQLVTLPPGIFAGLTMLQNLYLFNNQLPLDAQEAIRRELPATTHIGF